MITTKIKNLEVEKFDFRFLNISALIIKVTNKCNIDCKYCYENISRTGDVLSIDLFKKIAEKAIVSSINKNISFIFHGGEPTLLPISWYKEAVFFCNELGNMFCKTIQFRLQTNFISVSEKKIIELNGLGIKLSASLDAFDSEQISERGLAPKVVSNIYRAKALNVRVNILSTINKSNFNSFTKFMDLLSSELNLSTFKANVAYPVGSGKNSQSLTAEEIFIAKRDMLQYMIDSNGTKITEVNLLKQVQKYFSPNQFCESNELCDKRTCGAGKTVLGFNLKGDILPCGRFSWNDNTHFLGNVGIPIIEGEHEEKISVFQTNHSKNWADCDNCSAKQICNFGCQAFIIRSISKTNIECKSTKMIYEFLERNKLQLQGLLLNNRNLINTGYGDDGYSDHGYSDYHDSM